MNASHCMCNTPARAQSSYMGTSPAPCSDAVRGSLGTCFPVGYGLARLARRARRTAHMRTPVRRYAVPGPRAHVQPTSGRGAKRAKTSATGAGAATRARGWRSETGLGRFATCLQKNSLNQANVSAAFASSLVAEYQRKSENRIRAWPIGQHWPGPRAYDTEGSGPARRRFLPRALCGP